jgi:hypothetical protein
MDPPFASFISAPTEITSLLCLIGLLFLKESVGASHMATNQVVLYFDKQEDALLFTVAASSIMATDGPLPSSDAGVNVAVEISKASRITTEGVLNIT